MKIITDPREMQQLSLALRKEGKTIAFVPTMGYLHQGHQSLLRQGRTQGDILVLSIFVNPTQFGAGEDLETYPRDLTGDAAQARECGVDYLFAPQANEIYPRGYATYVDVEGLTDTLCGASRPGHFRGVTTIVTKLFNLVQPHVALFGQKDFQQLAVLRRMTEDLNLPVEVVGMPIIRETDGLAMSSRNSYLTADERRQALCLVDSLRQASDAVRSGERAAAVVRQQVQRRIEHEQNARIDYIHFGHRDTLQAVEVIDESTVLLLAVHIGKTRLIDNHILFEEV